MTLFSTGISERLQKTAGCQPQASPISVNAVVRIDSP
jgi:hypothetical protein